MRLNVFDENTLELVGVLTQYESVQWDTTFNTPDGSFQINTDPAYKELLVEGRILENTECKEHVGVIKKVQIVTSNEKTAFQVNGIMFEKDVFYKRVIKSWIVYQNMYPTEVLYNIIALSLIEPAEPKRKMEILGEVSIPKIEEVPDMTPIEYSTNYSNLGDEVFNLIQNLNLGVRSKINHETKKIDVEFYSGKDRTFGSDDPVVFSPERGTVIETNYSKDSTQNINELTVIGQDNVILKAERERDADEPLIEKSIDLSSELPWPTYSVEKPNEEGGQYYRYKKYTPPADFITNRDVWEKYAVDRIEKTETRYRESLQVTAETMTLKEYLENSELYSNATVHSKQGVVLGSGVSAAATLSRAIKNAIPGEKRKLGNIIKRVTKNAPAVNKAVYTTDLTAVQALSQKDLRKAKVNTGSKKKPVKKVNKKPNVSNKSNKKPLNGIITAASGATKVIEITAKLDKNQEVIIEQQEVTLEPYEYTEVTYETKDFLEYVYVNIGDDPSISTKIIQGSVASGDIMYYENFEETKIEEAKYRDMLMKKAEEYLKTFVTSETVDVVPYYLAKISYDIGDLVTARNSKLGFATDLRITGKTEIWDDKGYSKSVTLGSSIPSLTNRIKLISKGGV